ncbi:C40 family peptidase [Streptomyces sp. NPDC090741]|uniref:C40 family peptidase n=1 Tax=Streptomyces sp. NPDC090741 TaxID=3365967 RepID=UPI00381B488E
MRTRAVVRVITAVAALGSIGLATNASAVVTVQDRSDRPQSPSRAESDPLPSEAGWEEERPGSRAWAARSEQVRQDHAELAMERELAERERTGAKEAGAQAAASLAAEREKQETARREALVGTKPRTATVRRTAGSVPVPAQTLAKTRQVSPAALAAMPSVRASTAVGGVLAEIGKPYVWGAEGPSAFDCSGLMQYVYARAGIRLPRTTWDQINAGSRVPVSQVRPGDLIFYRGGAHVGMYVGDGKVVHAPRPGRTVTTQRIDAMPVFAVVRPF